MVEKFTFDLQFGKIRKKLILVKEEDELRGHVVLKLLAYILFYHPQLKVEVSVGMHYKPDLVLLDEDGRPALWIDCGYVAVLKVQSLARKFKNTRLVFLKSNQRELAQFKRLIEKKVDHPERLEYLAFDDRFVDQVAEHLKKNNEITYYPVMEHVIGLAVNDGVFESALFR